MPALPTCFVAQPNFPSPAERIRFLADESSQEVTEKRGTDESPAPLFGLGRYVLAAGPEMQFPPGLQLGFDFRRAVADGTIIEITPGPGCDRDFLRDELGKLGIETVDSDSAI
jgi:hypothetical protein